jgi:hypothetical protein
MKTNRNLTTFNIVELKNINPLKPPVMRPVSPFKEE